MSRGRGSRPPPQALHRESAPSPQVRTSKGRTIFALACAAFVLPVAGCYEHVTKGGMVTRDAQQRYEPNVEDEGPSILNELMWGAPPKGEDPVKYYRRKNTLGIQQ